MRKKKLLKLKIKTKLFRNICMTKKNNQTFYTNRNYLLKKKKKNKAKVSFKINFD